MQSQLPSYMTGEGLWNRYVNKTGSTQSARWLMERTVGQDGEWQYDVPIWNIMYTEDGCDYHDVGTITAFSGDGVQATIWNQETVAGNDPYDVFEAAVGNASAFDLGDWYDRDGVY